MSTKGTDSVDRRSSGSSSPVARSSRERGWYSPQVGLFLLLAFGISWGVWMLRMAAPESLGPPLLYVMKYGPSLAGVLAVAIVAGRVGLVDLGRRLKPFGFGLGWFLLAFLLAPALGLVVLGLRVALGGPVPLAENLGLVGALAIFGSQLALRFFAGGGLGEELGWRGFMLPELRKRVGWIRASLCVGLWHGLWHLPAQGAAVVILIVFTVSAAILLTWMADRTGGNLFLASLLHASGNATLFSMELILPALDDEPMVQLLFLALWLAFAVAVVLIVERSHEHR